jgi:hypothetical protein
MNKFSSVFGTDSINIFKRGILQSSSRDRGREEGKRIYLLVAICRNVILPIRIGYSLREICGGLASCIGKLRHLGVDSVPTR